MSWTRLKDGKKIVVFIEPFRFIGHRKNYLLIYTTFFKKLGYDVKVLLKNKLDAQTIEPEHADLVSDIEFHELIPPRQFVNKLLGKINSIFRWDGFLAINYWLSLRHSVERVQPNPDVIVILWFDIQNAIYKICLPLIPKNLVVLDGQSVNPIATPGVPESALTLQNVIYKTNRLKGVLLLNEEACEYYRQQTGSKNIRWIPEVFLLPKESPANEDCVDRVKEFANGREIVLNLGAISERNKGILDFLNMARAMKDRQIVFVAVGRLHSDHFTNEEMATYQRLKKELENLLILEYFPNDSEYIELIKTASWVYMVYRNHPHSSNLLAHAIHFEKKVIVAAGTLMERRVKKYKLGYTFDEILQEPGLINSFIGKDRFDSFNKDCSKEIAVKQLTEILN